MRWLTDSYNSLVLGQNLAYADIISPSAMEYLGPDDVVFISSAQDVVEKLMKSIAGESKGLSILQSNVLALPGYGSELIECVISDTNPFLGKTVTEALVQFGEKYKAAIVTARGTIIKLFCTLLACIVVDVKYLIR